MSVCAFLVKRATPTVVGADERPTRSHAPEKRADVPLRRPVHLARLSAQTCRRSPGVASDACSLLDHGAHHGGEQRCIARACSLHGPRSDDERRERVQGANRVTSAHRRSFEASRVGRAVPAFGAGSLRSDRLGKRTVPIQGDAQLAAAFPGEIRDTAVACGTRRMITALARRGGKEQRATTPVRAGAVGMRKRNGWGHAHALVTERNAIAIAPAFGMPMLGERDSGHASPTTDGVRDVPGVERGSSREVRGKEASCGNGVQRPWHTRRDVAFVQRVRVLSQHHIAGDRVGTGRDPRPRATQAFFFHLCAAIGLDVGAAFCDAQTAIGIPCGDVGHMKRAFTVHTWVVLAHPGGERGHIEGDDVTESWDVLAQRLDGVITEGVPHRLRTRPLRCTEPAVRWHGSRDITARGVCPVEHRSNTQFQHEHGVFQKNAASMGAGAAFFHECQPQDGDGTAESMRTFPRTVRGHGTFRDDVPMEEGNERTGALDQRVMLNHAGERLLVNDLRMWDQTPVLLAGDVGAWSVLLCLHVSLSSRLMSRSPMWDEE